MTIFVFFLGGGSTGRVDLVAPYCAIPRDYLSDTPLLHAMGFLVSQRGKLGAIPPPPFLSIFPFGEHAKWRCDTPLKRGISAILARYPMKTRQMGAIPPSAILSRKGIARYGGVSRPGPLRGWRIFFCFLGLRILCQPHRIIIPALIFSSLFLLVESKGNRQKGKDLSLCQRSACRIIVETLE